MKHVTGRGSYCLCITTLGAFRKTNDKRTSVGKQWPGIFIGRKPRQGTAWTKDSVLYLGGHKSGGRRLTKTNDNDIDQNKTNGPNNGRQPAVKVSPQDPKEKGTKYVP